MDVVLICIVVVFGLAATWYANGILDEELSWHTFKASWFVAGALIVLILGLSGCAVI